MRRRKSTLMTRCRRMVEAELAAIHNTARPDQPAADDPTSSQAKEMLRERAEIRQKTEAERTADLRTTTEQNQRKP